MAVVGIAVVGIATCTQPQYPCSRAVFTGHVDGRPCWRIAKYGYCVPSVAQSYLAMLQLETMKSSIFTCPGIVGLYEGRPEHVPYEMWIYCESPNATYAFI